MVQFHAMAQFCLTWRGGLVVVAVVGIASLAVAFVAQYVFGVQPCVLCLWQRLPYALCVAVGLAGAPPFLRRWRGALLLLCALLLLIEVGIAFFHVGVEQHWWLGTAECSLQPTAAMDSGSLREALLATPVVRCDEVTWTFLGLSMASWNVPFALLMCCYALYVALMGKPDGQTNSGA